MSCQVQHTGDTSLEFFPSSTTPGDCGTFIATGGALYTPDFSNHGPTATGSLGTRTAFAGVSQSAASGSGSSSNPVKVTTVVNVGGTGLRITQTDTYITGQESYRTDVKIQNTGGGQQAGIVYRAGDCFLQNSDSGFGFTSGTSVGCSATANNTPPGRIEEFFPITGGNNFTEDGYSTVWSQIGAQTPFPNACAQCTAQLDNGAGISWNFSIPGGGSATFSHYTTFSPTGRTGPPPATTAPRRISPRRFGLPPNNRCFDKRKFRFRLRRPAGYVVKAQVFVNNVPVKTVKGHPRVRRISIRRLPNRGRFVVKIIATQNNGTRLLTKRTYTKCKKSKPKGRKLRRR